MARRKKDQAGPALPLSENEDDILAKAFDRHNTLKEEAKEVNSAASSLRRELKERGLSNRAVTTGCALRTLEEGGIRDDETRGILRAIRAANPAAKAIAAAVFGLAEQTETVEAAPAWGQWADDVLDACERPAELEPDTAEVQPADEPRPEVEDVVEAPPADWGDNDEAPAAEIDATGAVAAYNAGLDAGQDGTSESANPYDGRSTIGKAWKRGWQNGVTAREAPLDDGDLAPPMVEPRESGEADSLAIPPFLVRDNVVPLGTAATAR